MIDKQVLLDKINEKRLDYQTDRNIYTFELADKLLVLDDVEEMIKAL